MAKTVFGYDPDQEIKKLWRTGIESGLWANSFGFKHVPKLTVRQSKTKHYTTGTAWNTHKIALTLGKEAGPGDLLGVLAHEVSHLLLPWGVHHSAEFWACQVSLIQSHWGVLIDLSGLKNGVERQRRINTDLGAFLIVENWFRAEKNPALDLIIHDNLASHTL